MVRPSAGQRPHESADPHDALRVEPVDRLVEHQDGRVAEQGGGDAQPLAHAQREPVGPAAGDGLQTDDLEHLLHPLARMPLLWARQNRWL